MADSNCSETFQTKRTQEENLDIPAIEMSDIYKRFRHNCVSVLNGLDLKKCHAQKIYVLYGAIKSGKSTVMRIILNLCQSDHGKLTILGNSIASRGVTFGYMPQHLGLDPCLTICETVKFHGLLKGMNQPAIMTKLKELRNSLGMFNLRVPVASLQEHQQRILGFFVASLGNPKILVLDEPTSGCDPIYKHFIWQHIKLLVADSNTTVIMTASDGGECIHADVMGYLRDGKLLVEDAPMILLAKFNINNIQRLLYCVAFVDTKYAFPLSSSSQTNVASIDDTALTESETCAVDTRDEILEAKQAKSFDRPRSEQMTLVEHPQQPSTTVRLQTMIVWNVMLIVRNLRKLSLQTVLPLVALVMYFYAVNGTVDNVNLAVVGANLKAGFGCTLTNYSIDPTTSTEALCQIVDLIDSNVVRKHYFNTTTEAELNQRKGLVSGILEIITPAEAASNLSPELRLHLDATSNTLSTILWRRIHEAHEIYKRNRNRSAPTDELTLRTNRLNDNRTDAVHLIWGAVAVVTHFCGALMGALPLANKGKRQIDEQLSVLGVKRSEMQLVHWVSRMSFAIVQNLLVKLCVMTLLQDVFSSGSFAIGWLLVMGQTACGFSFGIFLFTLFGRAAHILLAAIVTELLASIVSGFLWHYLALAPIFQHISHIIPHYSVAEALHALVIKGVCITSKQVWLGFVVPSFWTGLMFVCHLVLDKYFKP